MFAASSISPSVSPIRWVLPPGPHDVYPRGARRPSKTAQRGQVNTIVAIVFAALAAFGVGFVAGATDGSPAAPASGPMPGEFRLGPGNLPPPGIVVPLD